MVNLRLSYSIELVMYRSKVKSNTNLSSWYLYYLTDNTAIRINGTYFPTITYIQFHSSDALNMMNSYHDLLSTIPALDFLQLLSNATGFGTFWFARSFFFLISNFSESSSSIISFFMSRVVQSITWWSWAQLTSVNLQHLLIKLTRFLAITFAMSNIIFKMIPHSL